MQKISRQGGTPPAVFQCHECFNPRVGSGIFSNFTGREHVLRTIEVGVCRSICTRYCFMNDGDPKRSTLNRHNHGDFFLTPCDITRAIRSMVGHRNNGSNPPPCGARILQV